jgi:serine/threonine protein phosphatase 1
MFSWLWSLNRRPRHYPPAPAGLTLYAIGDIHGRLDCLHRAFGAIDRDAKGRPGLEPLEIYLGDYVDRGPDSMGVIEALLNRTTQRNAVFLRGDHEMLFESFLRGLITFEAWRPFGGLETALSYGVDAGRVQATGYLRRDDLARLVPNEHVQFLSGLSPYFVVGPYLFVHAGLRPGVPLEKQTINDFAWIRDEFIEHQGPFGHIVVHGHSAVAEIEFHAQRINIDTSASASNRLSVIRIDNRGVTNLAAGSR